MGLGEYPPNKGIIFFIHGGAIEILLKPPPRTFFSYSMFVGWVPYLNPPSFTFRTYPVRRAVGRDSTLIREDSKEEKKPGKEFLYQSFADQVYSSKALSLKVQTRRVTLTFVYTTLRVTSRPAAATLAVFLPALGSVRKGSSSPFTGRLGGVVGSHLAKHPMKPHLRTSTRFNQK